MQLKNGPLRVLNNSILVRPLKCMHGTRKDDKRKLDDQGDGRDEGAHAQSMKRYALQEKREP